MKKRRFLSVFFALLLACSLFPAALAEEAASPGASIPPDPGVTAKHALLLELSDDGDTVLYEKAAHDRAYPASLTKIMTALLVLESVHYGRLTWDQTVVASSVVNTLPADSSTGGIKAGEALTVRQLMEFLLIISANESANILAEAVSGSVDAFVDAMNKRAEELGCEDTRFVNAHGYHDPNHYTTAWDTYLITREAMKYPSFMKICDTAELVIPATNIGPERTLRTTNYLIERWRSGGKYKNPDAHGIKTGSTSDAGLCLVASANRTGRQLLSVVMAAERVTNEDKTTDARSFSDTNRLFNWGFDNFKWKTLLDAGEEVSELPVELSETDHVLAVTKDEIAALVPVGLEGAHMEQRATYPEQTLEAPVEAGQTVGKLSLHYSIPEYGFSVSADTELLAATGAERSKLLALQRDVVELVQSTRFRVGAAASVALIVLLVIARAVAGRRRSRYGNQNDSKGGGGYRGRKR